ncbi:MAG: hypothetical protein N0C90_26975 [Candidatus Thiodiazotropha endolucinida]|nr:hypothetical protein [Candidatus Thiodiazotropha taylori]MCW4264990.1 hypothetical protein [Candidatus Thiodiazotropha endolucinida]
MLVEDIEKIEKDPLLNYEVLDLKRTELYELRKKKIEGIKIRSRAKWISEGEKTTKYFCNLEKRNFVSKCMNSLINESGVKINDQKDILQETLLFSKNYILNVITQTLIYLNC